MGRRGVGWVKGEGGQLEAGKPFVRTVWTSCESKQCQPYRA